MFTNKGRDFSLRVSSTMDISILVSRVLFIQIAERIGMKNFNKAPFGLRMIAIALVLAPATIGFSMGGWNALWGPIVSMIVLITIFRSHR